MAKSLRSKVKRHFRAKKREEGVYAATEAARLHRLHMKLKTLTTTEPEEHDEDGEQGAQMETEGGAAPSADAQSSAGNTSGADAMDLDSSAGPSSSTSTDPNSSSATTKRISTHGPRNSRREQWRASKGLPARPKSKGLSRQGVPAARRKAGRSHRRR